MVVSEKKPRPQNLVTIPQLLGHQYYKYHDLIDFRFRIAILGIRYLSVPAPAVMVVLLEAVY